jgi:lycopene beta-cyclase
MKSDDDLVILGGGCAGLSLAMRLARLGDQCPQTTILEARESYANDRTWCFWGTSSAQLTSLVRHHWNRVEVMAEGRRLEVDCTASPYGMIPASIFYETALKAVAGNNRIRLLRRVAFDGEPVRRGDRWEIPTTEGLLRPRWIVDTRPVRPPRRDDAILWQSFFGQEIRCDTACFKPDCATLMDFLPVTGQRIMFLYVLPTTERQALVEVTAFAPDPLGPDILQPILKELLAGRLKFAKSQLVRAESGSLPMGLSLVRARSHPDWLCAGLPGGGARPASGFAFQRIQRWADQCAEQLARGLRPCAQPADPWRLRAMDELFLRVLRRHPETAPGLFLRLFAMRDTAAMVRFLSDCPRWADCYRIIRALPPGPFLRELGNTLLSVKNFRSQPI